MSLVICSQSSKNEHYFFYDDGDDDDGDDNNDGGGDDDNYCDNDNVLEVHSPDWGSLKRKPGQQNSLHL